MTAAAGRVKFRVFEKQVQCHIETYSKDWRQTFTKTESVMFSY